MLGCLAVLEQRAGHHSGPKIDVAARNRTLSVGEALLQFTTVDYAYTVFGHGLCRLRFANDARVKLLQEWAGIGTLAK